MKTTSVLFYLLISNLFLNIFPVNLYAQKADLSFQHFGVEQGMSSESIAGIYQDNRGYMWFLTDNGVDRYDGYNFTTFKYPKKDKIVPSLFTNTICEDKDGIFWVASLNGGIEKFDPVNGTFHNYLPDPKNPANDWSNTVISICIDKYEAIWVGSGDGLYKFNKKTQFFTVFKHDKNDTHSLAHNSVNCIFEDNEGNLWIGTGAGLDRFDRQTNQFLHYWNYPNNYWGNLKGSSYWILSFAEDSNNILWIGTDGGLLKFDKDNGKFILYDSYSSHTNVVVTSLCLDDFDRIWFTPMDGLEVFNKKTGTFLNYKHDVHNPVSLSGNFVHSVFYDRSGSIWIGTRDRGLNKLDLTNLSFKEYLLKASGEAGNSLDGVYDFYEEEKGKIRVATNKAIMTFDPQSGVNTKKQSLNASDMGFDNAGKIWIIPMKNGLYKLEKDNKWTCYIDSIDASYGDLVTALYLRRENQYWLGNRRGQLYSLDPTTKEFKLITNINKVILTIYEDAGGLVWFGGFSTGLYCYNPDNKTINEYNSVSDDSSTLTDNSFYSFCEDGNGTLWIGCENGIAHFNRKKNNFTRYYGNGDFLKGDVRQIIEDDHGYLWISTKQGITRFNPSTGEFKDFYAVKYFPDITFWRRTGFKSKNGELYFGGANGFIRFHPDSIQENAFKPPVVITAFKKFDKYYPFRQEIELQHDENYLTFEFAALSYIHSEENQYAYMMEGIDKDWVYCGTRRFATYPNLNPGDYIFKVKGSDCNRVWNEAGTSIEVIILPPWWKTWWAYILYTLVIISVFITSTRFYLNRQRLRHKLILESEHAGKLEEIAKMKSDFFANISHEFRTPLTLISGPAEKIIAKSADDEISKNASIISRNSSRLLQLVNQLLDLSRLDSGKLRLEASPGNIVSFVKGIALSFESFTESRDIMLTIKSEKEFIDLYFDREKMIKVLSNLLSNAFKFSPVRGKVIINIDELPQNIVAISIRNTDVAIPQKDLPKLFDRFYQVDSSQTKEYEGTGIGLALVKELVELHYGNITVESREADQDRPHSAWTEFTVSLPLGRDHLREDEILTADNNVSDEEELIYEADYPQPHSLTVSGSEKDKNRRTVLVVEDNYDMRQYIKESLADNYLIEEAVNGEQGVRIAENNIPDLVISDLMMPKMDGNELTRILKNDERTNHIPIIILTAKTGQESKIEGLIQGADDYLTKPFDIKELGVRVENLIEIRRKLQEKYMQGDFLLKPASRKLKNLDEKFLARVLEVIEKHLSEEDFSIEECSNEVGMSRAHLHKKLKALVGKSPSQYVRSVRLHHAKQMIEEQRGNVSEAAYSVGFSTPAYFSKCFKDEFGHSPSEVLGSKRI